MNENALNVLYIKANVNRHLHRFTKVFKEKQIQQPGSTTAELAHLVTRPTRFSGSKRENLVRGIISPMYIQDILYILYI